MTSDGPRADLVGRVALVTGGGGGIGSGIARCLAAAGARVVVNDIDGAAAAAVAEGIATTGGLAVPAPGDVSDDEAVAQLFRDHPAVDILVNNVGVSHDGAGVLDLPLAELDRMLALNLRSQVLCIRAGLPRMVGQGWGRIVNVSSRTWLGAAGLSFYSASKGGVISLSRSLALETGGTGVTVNVVAPGTIRSKAFDAQSAARQEQLRGRSPARRFGEPSDVGRAVCFLVSPAARAITGQLLHVCGGRSIYGGPMPEIDGSAARPAP